MGHLARMQTYAYIFPFLRVPEDCFTIKLQTWPIHSSRPQGEYLFSCSTLWNVPESKTTIVKQNLPDRQCSTLRPHCLHVFINNCLKMLSIEVINCDWIKPSLLTPYKQPGFELTTATLHKLNHHLASCTSNAVVWEILQGDRRFSTVKSWLPSISLYEKQIKLFSSCPKVKL